ncbi:MAG TPA: hypothetical protein VJ646_06100 [Candidatus Binatia bacterium]|nr:hypothetical protein [Candidatus Binatia bacterium]
MGVKARAALVVLKRDPLVDGMISFRIAGPQRDRQEAIDVLRQTGVMTRIGCRDQQRRMAKEKIVEFLVTTLA